MVRTIRAHFDGRYIVPDEPLDIPPNQPLQVQLILQPSTGLRASLKERQAAAEWFRNNPVRGSNLPDRALSRESIYGED